MVVIISIYVMADMEKETWECSWLLETFILYLSKWSHSSTSDSLKAPQSTLQSSNKNSGK